MTCFAPYDGVSSVTNDTLFVLLSNYCPPPFIEAFNYTLYQGHYNANQLDSAGYIDIAGNNVLHLDSIYRGFISIPNANSMQIAINNSIGIYQHFDSIATSPRQFNLNIGGYTGNYSGQLFIVDSTQNNMQFKYDSLLTAGYTQASAISTILPNQSIHFSTISLNAGQYPFSLYPNSVCLFKIKIPGVNSSNENRISENNFLIYPNPTKDLLNISYTLNEGNENYSVLVYNMIGQEVLNQNFCGENGTVYIRLQILKMEFTMWCFSMEKK
jgi:hypothetical protein